MARITLANGRILDTETGAMSGGNLAPGDPTSPPDPTDPYGTGDANAGVAAPTPPATPTAPAGGGTPQNPNTNFGNTGITIPLDIYDELQSAASRYGIPLGYLAASIYFGRPGGFVDTTRNQLTASIVQKFAQDLSNTVQQSSSWAQALSKLYGANVAALIQQNYPNSAAANNPQNFNITSPTRAGTAGGTAGTGTAAQRSLAAPVTADDILSLYQTYLGRAPENQGAIDGRLGRSYGQVLNEISSSSEAAQYRIKGDEINSIRSNWANSMWQTLFGRPPTNTEIMNIINNGWNPQQTQTFLETQPYGTAKNPDGSPKTVGQAATIRDAVTKAFQKAGLTADEGTINDFIANNHPISNADAYVSQYIKQHGMVNPQTFTDMRKRLADALAGFGTPVNTNDVDPALLQRAIAGNWTADQMTQEIGAMQAPGTPTGTTLNQYKSTTEAMNGIWNTYFPTTTMSQWNRDVILQSKMTPDQMAAFIGNMPSLDAQAAGLIVPVKTYTDAKAAASKALGQWGAVGAVPTPADIAYFAAHGFDAEAIHKHYQTDPTVLAANPGAQYGMTREQYRTQRGQIEQTYARDFAAPSDLAQTKAKQSDVTPGGDAPESDWLSAIFSSGQTPQQANAMFADTFKRQGRAPTPEEIGSYQSRHTEAFGGSSQGGGQGGMQPQLAGPSARRR